MSEYDVFRVVDILDAPAPGSPLDSNRRYSGVQCTSCETVVWEPLKAGDELQDVTDACREHMCDDYSVLVLS